MTKREFDKLTKINHGGDDWWTGRDELCNYLEDRHREHGGSGSHYETYSPICYFTRRRRTVRKGLGVLELGSKFRSPQKYAAKTGGLMTTKNPRLVDASRLPV